VQEENPPPLSPTFLLIALGRRLREQVETALRPHGLTLRHVGALGHLRRRPGLSITELARRAGVTPQSMQATLQQLEDRSAVRRDTEPGRGRTAELHVTPFGDDLLRIGRAAVTAADDAFLADVPADARAALLTSLTRLFMTDRTANRP
jgi:DNA-binding MarR family transcriptional regulator